MSNYEEEEEPTLKEKFFMLGVLIAVLAIGGFAAIEIITIIPAFGENYTFNMTAELNNESKLLEKCINIDSRNVSNSMKESCWQIYGGPVTGSALDKLKDELGIPGPRDKSYEGPNQK